MAFIFTDSIKTVIIVGQTKQSVKVAICPLIIVFLPVSIFLPLLSE